MSDKTYSEVSGVAAFDWHHALANPDQYKRGELFKRSGEWTTCACGNMCAIIPRAKTDEGILMKGAPLDFTLRMLGVDFHDFVEHKEWNEAMLCLSNIEIRSAALIAEELTKRNA